MMVKRLKMCLWQFASCIALLFVAAGCEDHEPQPEPQPVAAVNERLLLSSTYIYQMDDAQYNADKRPKSFTLSQDQKVSVVYSANSATYTTKVNGKVTRIKVYELENNIATKSTEYDVDANGNQTEVGVQVYSYKSGKLYHDQYFENGILLGYNEYIYDQQNENITELRVYDHNGLLKQKNSYTYTDIIDKSVLFNEWDYRVEGTLFPKWSKNLILTRQVEVDGIVVESVILSYVLDAQGYVTSATETPDGGSEYTWTNTWQ